MAGQSISITRGPTTVTLDATGAPISLSARDALDLSGLNGLRFDVTLRGIFLSGTSSPTATVTVQTSMTNDDNPTNWTTLGTAFSAISASNTSLEKSFTTGVLRYVRWSVVLTGAATSFTFEILGMAW